LGRYVAEGYLEELNPWAILDSALADVNGSGLGFKNPDV
jgi:hypothetical protein